MERVDLSGRDGLEVRQEDAVVGGAGYESVCRVTIGADYGCCYGAVFIADRSGGLNGYSVLLDGLLVHGFYIIDFECNVFHCIAVPF